MVGYEEVFTDNLAPGVVVPIPTLPPLVIIILSRLLVLNCKL